MKTNQLLAGVFVILLIPTSIKVFAGGVDYLEERPKLFDGLISDNIAVIEIRKPKSDDSGKPSVGKDGKPSLDQIVFERSEKEWTIVSGPFAGQVKARGTDIESRILEPIGKIEASASTIILDNADENALAGYGLDDKSATILRLIDGNKKEVAQLIIGRSAGGIDAGSDATSGTYVRRPKEKIIVLASADFALDATEDRWVEKSVQDIDEAEVVELHLSNEHGEVAFKREEEKDWQVAKGPEDVGAMRKDEVQSLLSRARSIVVQDFLVGQEHPKHGLATPQVQVKVKTKDGKVHLLAIGKQIEGKQQYYAFLQSNPRLLFSLADWDVTPFQKQPKDFFDPKKDPKEDPKEDPKKDPKESGEKGDPAKGNTPKEVGDKPKPAPGDKPPVGKKAPVKK